MIEMNILTHDEAKRLSQSSTDPLEVIRNVEVAVVVKLAGMQNALKDEIRLVWKPKCDALRQQLEVESKAAAHWMEEANMEHNKNVRLSQQLEAAILRTYGAKGRYHTEQSAKEMFALVNAA